MDVTGLDQRDRIRKHTSPPVNARLDAQTRANIEAYGQRSPMEIGRRLGELDHEWHVDRALMANFAVLGGLSFALAVRSLRPRNLRSGWLYLFSTQLGFLLAHSLWGWCPPVPVFRRLGFRSHDEIEEERRALLRKAEQH